MKMEIGPYKGRFYGELPIVYQKYLLDNIKRLQDKSLIAWLNQQNVLINNRVRRIHCKKLVEDMKIMEALCGSEFQPAGTKIDKIATQKDAGRA